MTGWPTTVINRGRVVVSDNELRVEPGLGQFPAQERSEFARPLGQLAPETDPDRNFGAQIL